MFFRASLCCILFVVYILNCSSGKPVDNTSEQSSVDSIVRTDDHIRQERSVTTKFPFIDLHALIDNKYRNIPSAVDYSPNKRSSLPVHYDIEKPRSRRDAKDSSNEDDQNEDDASDSVRSDNEDLRLNGSTTYYPPNERSSLPVQDDIEKPRSRRDAKDSSNENDKHEDNASDSVRTDNQDISLKKSALDLAQNVTPSADIPLSRKFSENENSFSHVRSRREVKDSGDADDKDKNDASDSVRTDNQRGDWDISHFFNYI